MRIEGLRLAATASGIKKRNAPDLMLAVTPKGSRVAGVFTSSTTAAVAVERSRKLIAGNGGKIRALLVNSGNANVFTGSHGAEALTAMVRAAAKTADCRTEEVFVASTGVIGEQLPFEKIVAAVPLLGKNLAEDNWQAAAEAIMTTDTKPKTAFAKASVGGKEVRLGAIAKGAGMVAPNMATMLAFIFTDLALEIGRMRQMLNRAVAHSFNAITVEGDTSTSDTCLLVSTNRVKAGGDVSAFAAALRQICAELAAQIVRDAEGAKKLITVRVSGGANQGQAKRVAFAIAESPLVKIALGAADPNWGRIVMAIGKSGVKVDQSRITIALNRIKVAENGGRAGEFDEETCRRALQEAQILVEVGLGNGNEEFTVLTSDLNADYIRINADYRT